MKGILHITRVLVGLLFIFSGLIKANDPLGLSYKMDEFLEIWGLHFGEHLSLFFSVTMNAFEVIAGFALLVGWRMRLFSWLLLLLILFFTFLTGYAYFSGKVKECGCFGNCIPLQAQATFIKDIILLVLILFLFFKRNQVKPLFSPIISGFVLILVSVLSFGIQWYTLTFLPVLDCLPYKVGNNLAEKMKPTGTTPDKFDYVFVYQNNGKQKEFRMNELGQLNDSWKFVERKEVLIQKGDMKEPEIRDFALKTLDNIDSTESILQRKGKTLLLFINKIRLSSTRLNQSFSSLLKVAAEHSVPVYVVSSTPDEVNEYFNKKHQYQLPVLKLDGVAFKTAARVNPTVILLDHGRVAGKWSYARFDDARNHIHSKTVAPSQP